MKKTHNKKTCLQRYAPAAVLMLCLLLLPAPLPQPLPPPFIHTAGPLPLPRAPEKTSAFFPVPDALHPRISFWKQVFTEYTRQQVLLHDEYYVNIIYEITDLEKKEEKPWQRVRAAQEKYRNLLKEMDKKWDTPELMPREVRRLFLLYKTVQEIPRFRIRDAQKRVHAQIGQADSFRQGMIFAGRYLEDMKEILRIYGIPEKLGCLPLIESAYNPYAVSFAGAAGLWQLMDFTAKQYGLKMDHIQDQRRDPLTATAAAAQHLKNNYRVLQSWPLAITAYNHGLQGMINAVRSVKSSDISDIISQYEGKSFGYASRNFYPEFLAALEIFANPERYYGELEQEGPAEAEYFTLPHYVSVQSLEKYCGLSAEMIREMNPGLLESAYDPRNFLPKNYLLRLPPDCRIHMEENYTHVPAHLKYAKLPTPTRHRVRRGQTLSDIAKISGVSVRDLARFNNIRNPRTLRAGQILRIPGNTKQLSAFSASGPKKSPRNPLPGKNENRHRVRKGQTLSEIAQIYGISAHAIARINKIRNKKHIRAGQVLLIPEG
ncbi:MAG: LysM peptidoglycan-binding domain-containing protein [Desulfococcaceae bacterium]|jgi:membrane-bound lytic murein transglycosylase D|nr:LysM peptidoglycan-binding domain-containing protein [Desulfococcaceae bacterium]